MPVLGYDIQGIPALLLLLLLHSLAFLLLLPGVRGWCYRSKLHARKLASSRAGISMELHSSFVAHLLSSNAEPPCFRTATAHHLAGKRLTPT
jgi:hypothetical protein